MNDAHHKRHVPHATTPAVNILQLSVNYDKTPVLWDITMSVPPGLLVGIIGPNGAGKSTLVKAIMGIIKPMAGKVEIFGATLKQMRQRVAYIPQRESVSWDFPITVKELVVMGRYGRLGLLRRPRRADYEAAEQYLETVGLQNMRDRQIGQLSGGQQQRAFIARALMQEADLFFLDEPFTAIDIATEGALMGLLRRLRDNGKTIFVVHHDLTSVESYFDWVVMLNMHLVACGPRLQCFNSDTLKATYGQSFHLLDEVFRLSIDKTSGRQ